MQVCVKPGTRAAAIYQSDRATEKYYCNFGLNPAYQKHLALAGLEISGTDDAGEARIVELPLHPFFVGTLFVPQASSTKGSPHPMVLAFFRAATQTRRMKETFSTRSVYAKIAKSLIDVAVEKVDSADDGQTVNVWTVNHVGEWVAGFSPTDSVQHDRVS